MLLGQDFIKKFMPITIEKNLIIFSIQGDKVQVPAKSKYTLRVKPDEVSNFDEVVTDLSKIQKIVKHAEIHGPAILSDIVKKLKNYCIAEDPVAFWLREKYFVSLPFQKEGSIKSKKASANHMSPSEQYLSKNKLTV